MASYPDSAHVVGPRRNADGWLDDRSHAASALLPDRAIVDAGAGCAPFEMTTRQIAGVTWTGSRGFLKRLDALPSDVWTAPASQRGWVRVKHNTHRTVWRARIDGKLYYVKFYRRRPVRDTLKRIARKPACKAEFECGRFAAENGVAASRPVAYAEGVRQADGPCSVLVLDAIEPSEPLDEYWRRECMEAASAGARRALIESLAELIARAHQAGFEHTDMHAANILVLERRGGGLETHFVDLHAAVLNRPVRDAAIVRNLAQLNQWFRRHSSIKDRIRFLRAYLRWRGEFEMVFEHGRPIETSFRNLVRALVVMAEGHAQRLWSRRDRRALRSGRYFAKLRLGRGWRAIVVRGSKRPIAATGEKPRELPAGWWRSQLSDPRRLLRLAGGASHKRSHSAWVGQIELDHESGPVRVIIKRPLARNLRRRLRQLLPPSRCWRGWRAGHALLHRDIVTARPLALLERRLGPLVLDGLLLTEEAPEAVDLAEHLRRQQAARSPRGWRRHKRELTRVLVRKLRRLFERGFVHRDCKAENLLVLKGMPLRLCWVDMDGIRLVGRPARDDEAFGALARLWVSLATVSDVSRTDAARFLRAFSARFGRDPRCWRDAWRAIVDIVERKLVQRQARTQWKLRNYGRA